ELHGAGWRLRATGNAPASGAAMAFDAVGNRLLAFGGIGPIGEVNSTFVWTGTQWQQLTPANAPPPRQFAAMATDQVRQRVVLFGGLSGNTLLGDTWEWNGTTWSQRATTGPAARIGSLAFDPASNRVVLLGGNDLQTFHSDCWDWNGLSWSPRNNLPAPAMAHGFSDGTSLFAVLGPGKSDVVRWTGTAWTPVWTAATPGRRNEPAMCSDPAVSGLVLFGGESATTTWRWANG